ncbi:MAG TPA: trypsin-like peptidase domain-containing protein, partial [bacterium]|nr:trypsin-like peptidase domain-containing protein [bacterium]
MRLSRVSSPWVLAALVVFSLSLAPATAQPRVAFTSTEAVDQAVVQINVIQTSNGRTTRGTGSGVVIDSSGLVLTAAHVVTRATRIEVKVLGGDVVPARVVGIDPVFDAALVRIDTRVMLPVLPLGSSGALRREDPVTIFGRSPRRENGPSTGTFLWVNLEVRPGAPFLLTTAAAYPGDSGGAVVNAAGELVGIVSGISRDGKVSFAVAIDGIKDIYPDLLVGTVRHPWIGIVGETITDELAGQLGLLLRRGVFVVEVVEGSPAAIAGLLGGQSVEPAGLPRGGDIITSVDGRPIRSFGELAAYIISKRIGDSVTLQIYRNGRNTTVTIVLGERPDL